MPICHCNSLKLGTSFTLFEKSDVSPIQKERKNKVICSFFFTLSLLILSDIWVIFQLSLLCSNCKALSKAAIQLPKQRSLSDRDWEVLELTRKKR